MSFYLKLKGAKTLQELLLGEKKNVFFHLLLRLLRPVCVHVGVCECACVCTRVGGGGGTRRYGHTCLHNKQKPAKGNQSFMPRQFRNSHGIKIVKLLRFKKKTKNKFWSTASLSFPSHIKQPLKVTSQGMKVITLFLANQVSLATEVLRAADGWTVGPPHQTGGRQTSTVSSSFPH